MKWILRINHVLIVLFAVTSGIFKLVPGNKDLEVFAHLGLGAAAVGAFGVIQAVGGAGLLWRRTLQVGALVVAACNLFATAGLFAAGVQPFGIISLIFVGMALLELKRVQPERAPNARLAGSAG